MKKHILTGLFLLLVIFFSYGYVKAIECDPGIDWSKLSQSELQELRDVKCPQKLQVIGQQKNTLRAEIQYFDTQKYLTGLKIQETEQNIASTQKEIENLSSRIEGLDDSLSYLSKLLLKRVVEGYKRRSGSLFNVILNSQTANDFIDRVKYLKNAQDNNQKIIIQVQQAKLNFEEQKKLRETKKLQLDILINTLEQQKADLLSQQQVKKNLLAATNNDENVYQKLLDQARKQLSSFQAFTKAAGGGIISANGLSEGKEGWYMSQRDERWASRFIGLSNMNLLEVGCLITDIAMIYKKYGESVTPADIASQLDRFFSNTALMLVPWRGPGGRIYTPILISQIDEKLSQNTPVIAGLYAGAYGTHYVVLTKKEGDDYIMYDPYYGPDLKLSSHYGFGSIFSTVVFQ
ncbi:MAG: Peptidase M23 [Candidatus Roizmanbacteria bacterium GW2011_GWA2_36_23]|uniref:Peptidase M23 n=1 Tax=Candidatus Roizmanbacteria bacterium GW2011_GWA2_36_23 TaxID=1618480 RepID=A0A0G0E8Z6_9BACT|nr:MAG: Peptidase M23 [Candidatus Roizmanbacteria bacterium GW2011_GWA2_36_23]